MGPGQGQEYMCGGREAYLDGRAMVESVLWGKQAASGRPVRLRAAGDPDEPD
jgi:hypothetical protein